VTDLVRILQGLMLHVFWAERYGVQLSDERKSEVQIRSARRKIVRLLEIDPRPLSIARPPDLRLVGNCRDFSMLLAALLHVHGVPARARCGFGTYFIPGHYEDHWMTEYWLAKEGRWVQVDAQIDDLMRGALGIQFNPLDMPRRQFVLAGDAWQMCRAGQADPDDFGIFEYHGWDFIRGNVMRDFLALNNRPVLPWDCWGATEPAVAEFTPDQMAEVDHIAALSLEGNSAFDELRDIYERTPAYHIPEDWI